MEPTRDEETVRLMRTTPDPRDGFIIPGEEEAEEHIRAEFEALVAQLKEQDIQITEFGTAVAVTLTGTLPTGEGFSLRCRYSTCRLEISGSPTHRQTTKLDGTPFESFEAGALTAQEAAEMLAHLLGQAGHADSQERVKRAIS